MQTVSRSPVINIPEKINDALSTRAGEYRSEREEISSLMSVGDVYSGNCNWSESVKVLQRACRPSNSGSSERHDYIPSEAVGKREREEQSVKTCRAILKP